MWKKKFVYVLNYLETFKAVHKNWQVWSFGPNLPKKGVCHVKQ